MTHPNEKTRRQFLKSAAVAGLAAPTIISARAFASEERPAPSDRVVVGSIGVGDLGRRHHLLKMLIPNPRVDVAAICDVDAAHLKQAHEEASKINGGRKLDTYSDFRELCERKDIDAVLIATPDHWHALCAKYAMQCGKDVYCEKPLTYSIAEGRVLVDTARAYGTVFQVGSQQRSDTRFKKAVEIVHSGKLGKLERVDTFIGWVEEDVEWAPGEGQPAPVKKRLPGGKEVQYAIASDPPKELDWNFWLGPAPYAQYHKELVHYNFRWQLAYSGGKLTDWGAHHNDIAQWGMGADETGPVKVRGRGSFFDDGPYDVAKDFDVTFDYANGVELHCHSRGENGVLFTGSDGWVRVGRFSISASNPEWFDPALADFRKTPFVGNQHHNNWLDCIMSRERPAADVSIGHHSVIVCHLANIAICLQRELTWDPEKEEFVGDEEANRMTWRPMRGQWRL